MSENANEIIELVDEVTSPKTFNILDAISKRSYPHDVVNVFLDEQLAYDAYALNDEVHELQELSINDKDAAAKLVEVEKKFTEAVDKLEASRIEFHVYGLSEGDREDIYNISVKEFPIEYEESKNPYTGESVKNEVENKDRDKLFTTLLWVAQIRKIVSPDGSVQEGLTKKDVEELRRNLPIASIASINEAIDKVRAATATFMIKVNQDFLAKR